MPYFLIAVLFIQSCYIARNGNELLMGDIAGDGSKGRPGGLPFFSTGAF